jgi:hypothetical protein
MGLLISAAAFWLPVLSPALGGPLAIAALLKARAIAASGLAGVIPVAIRPAAAPRTCTGLAIVVGISLPAVAVAPSMLLNPIVAPAIFASVAELFSLSPILLRPPATPAMSELPAAFLAGVSLVTSITSLIHAPAPFLLHAGAFLVAPAPTFSPIPRHAKSPCSQT